MEYKTITRPDGSEQKLAVYDGKCRFWMEGLYDSLPDTAEKRPDLVDEHQHHDDYPGE